MINAWTALRDVLREATALGAKFRIVGADVELDGIAQLPSKIRTPVEQARDNRFLWTYLEADVRDEEAVAFLARWQVEPVLVTDPAKVGADIDALIEDLGSDPGPLPAIGIDIETGPDDWRPPAVKLKKDGGLYANQPAPEPAGLDPHTAKIQTLQLYAGGERCFVFKGPALQEALGKLPSFSRFVAHYAAFEAMFLRRYTGRFSRIECTLQASGLLYGVHRRGLDDTCCNIFGIEPPKDLQTSCWNARHLSAGQASYAAADAVVAYHMWPRLCADMQREGRLAAYELQTAVIPVVADMQLHGMATDLEEHRRQCEEWATELAEERRNYCEMTGGPPPSTPRQLQEWVASVVPDKVAAGEWPLTGKRYELSIKVKHLKRLIHAGNPTVKPMLRILALEKLISTFGPGLRNFVNPVTGRIHAHYSISGSKAGRFTCSKPNLQQLPNRRAPEFRECIVAGPGRVLVCCDWSQIELRAAAWISRDPVLTQAFADGLDLHRLAASAITGLPYDAITEDQRKAAKPVNFGWIYGISARTLAENAFADYDIEMPEVEAQRALDRYARKYPVLNQWRIDNAAKCMWRGRIDIGCGRILRAAWEIEQNGHLTFNQCCNIPIQGICADLLLRAMTSVHSRLARDGLDAAMVACAHDEILVEAAEKDAEQARRILEECMIEAFTVTFPGAPQNGVAAAAIGPSWLEAKP